jgi:hypothetical protein
MMIARNWTMHSVTVEGRQHRFPTIALPTNSRISLPEQSAGDFGQVSATGRSRKGMKGGEY